MSVYLKKKKKNYLALQTTWMKLHVYTIPPPHQKHFVVIIQF